MDNYKRVWFGIIITWKNFKNLPSKKLKFDLDNVSKCSNMKNILKF
ncbi:hypothetical protein M949_1260 [Riemerella anatipestifer CH3]|nr:hypothetical protein M949_1260 [Riemerella anatipestifer CH3]